MGKGNSFAHGINGNSGPNPFNDPSQTAPVQHGETCTCIWCLQGVR